MSERSLRYNEGKPDYSLVPMELLEEAAMLFFEWPERGEGLLPPATLTLRFDLEGDGRRVHGIVP